MTNLLIGYPDIPFRATSQTHNKTAATGYAATNLIGGDRQRAFELSAATADDLWVNYTASSSTAEFFAIIGAKEAQRRGLSRVSLRGSSASAFAPSSISGLKLWLDATRGVTADSSTNQVSQWDDQSGTGNTASQSTSANQPIISRGDNKENRVLYSDDLSNAAWANTNVTITTNAVANPVDGAITADAVYETVTAGTHEVDSSSPRIVKGESITMSVYVKANGRTWCLFLRAAGTVFTGTKYCSINLSTGALGTAVGGMSPTVTDAGSGWWKISWTETATGSGTSGMVVYAETANNTFSYAGDITKGLYVYGAQIRRSSTDSTYISTSACPLYAGVNGARSVFFDGSNDYLSANGLATTLTGNDTPFSAFVVYDTPNITTTGYLISAGNTGSTSKYLSICQDNATIRHERADDAASSTSATSSSSVTAGVRVVSSTFSGTTVSTWLDGVNIQNAASLNVGTMTLNIATIGALGRSTFGSYAGVRICEILVYNSALSDPDRQTIEAYLTAKWQTAPTVSNLTFATSTLYGPRSEDYIATFSTTSSCTNWWVQMSNDSTHKYRHTKQMFGRFFDWGRDPQKLLTHQRAPMSGNPRDAGHLFRLDWTGVTPAKVQTFIDTIYKYRDVFPVILYDPADVVLLDQRLLYCPIRSADFAYESSSTCRVGITFEELI